MDDQMMQRVDKLRGYIAEALQHRDRVTSLKIDEHGEIAVSHPDELEYVPMWTIGFRLCDIFRGRLSDRRYNDFDENDIEHLRSLLVEALDERERFFKRSGGDVTIEVINVLPDRKP